MEALAKADLAVCENTWFDDGVASRLEVEVEKELRALLDLR